MLKYLVDVFFFLCICIMKNNKVCACIFLLFSELTLFIKFKNLIFYEKE